MDAYFIIGPRNVGKSTLVRNLTGRRKQATMDMTIPNRNGVGHRESRLHFKICSLQEMWVTPEAFRQRVEEAGADAVLAAMWLHGRDEEHPRGSEYVEYFEQVAGWRVAGIAVLDESGPLAEFDTRWSIETSYHPNYAMRSPEVNAQRVRGLWRWQV